MTTAFTAIPIKMTTSAIRFLGGGMAGFYSTPVARSIDSDQCSRVFFVENHDG
jgi:hypothetical protein